jgi:hypothetical protein
MLQHLDAWDRSAERRHMERRTTSSGPREVERRHAERRAKVEDTLDRRRASDQEVLPDRPVGLADVAPPAQPSGQAAPKPPAGRDEAPLVIVTRTS